MADQGQQQGGPVGKVQIDRLARHPGPSGDLGHGQARAMIGPQPSPAWPPGSGCAYRWYLPPGLNLTLV